MELPIVLRSVPATIWNSFAWPAVAATACVFLGILTWRFRSGWLLWISFFVPGVWLGIALILIFNRPVWHTLYASPGIVVLAWVARYAAPVWAGLRLARREADRDLTDAARLNTGSEFALWRHVHGPQLAPIGAAAWYVAYLLCLWDVETLVLIVPPGGETLALRIFNLLHYGHNAQVNAMCLVLVFLALAPAIIWQTGRWLVVRWKRR
jgi:iron(III) transport system permease protein